MAPTSCTILEYLSRPNPKLKYTSPGHGTLTVHDRWLPIEGVRPWEDFTFDILSARYKSSLNKTITTYDPAQVIRHSCLDEIAGEDTVLLLLTINNIVPVSNALYETKKGFHFGPAWEWDEIQKIPGYSVYHCILQQSVFRASKSFKFHDNYSMIR